MSSDNLLAQILGMVSTHTYFDDFGFTFNLKSSVDC